MNIFPTEIRTYFEEYSPLDSNSEVETERIRTRSRSPNKRPIDKSRSNEITPVDVVIADIEGGLNTIDEKLQN